MNYIVQVNEDLQFSVSVTALERDGSDVRGLARIFFGDCFVINNVSIIQGKENLFVAMPSYKTKDVDENNKASYRDICHPITKEFREKLYTELITECEKQVEKTKEQKQLEKEQSEQKPTSMKQEKKDSRFALNCWAHLCHYSKVCRCTKNGSGKSFEHE